MRVRVIQDPDGWTWKVQRFRLFGWTDEKLFFTAPDSDANKQEAIKYAQRLKSPEVIEI